jgi:hypothetical protein
MGCIWQNTEQFSPKAKLIAEFLDSALESEKYA